MLNKNKKVCIVAPAHQYNDIRIFKKEAKTISKIGYKVFLLARDNINSEIDGIYIKAVPRYKKRFMRVLIQPWLFWSILKINPYIVHIHNPETLILGFFLKFIGKKVVYDVHEDFTQRILVRDWIPIILRKPIANIVSGLEKLASKHFDKIIATQEDVCKRLGGKCTIIENPPIIDSEMIKKVNLLAEKIETGEYFRTIYIGGINKMRGIEEMLMAMVLINETYNIKSRFWLAGPIDSELLKEIKLNQGWKYTDFLGELSQEEAFSYLVKSNAGLILYHKVGGHEFANPNKLFEYQLFGIPFIASNFELWQNLCGKNNVAGMFVEYNNIDAIASAMFELSTNEKKTLEYSQRGKNFIFKHYNWSIEEKKLIRLYEEL